MPSPRTLPSQHNACGQQNELDKREAARPRTRLPCKWTARLMRFLIWFCLFLLFSVAFVLFLQNTHFEYILFMIVYNLLLKTPSL